MLKKQNKISISANSIWLNRIETMRLLTGERNRSKWLRDLIDRGVDSLVKERSQGIKEGEK